MPSLNTMSLFALGSPGDFFSRSMLYYCWQRLLYCFQVGAEAFLQQALPELEQPGVRMVYSDAATSSSSCCSDIYDQVCMHPGTLQACQPQSQR